MVNHFLVYFGESLSDGKREKIETDPLVDSVYELSESNLLIRSNVADPRLLARVIGIHSEQEIAGVVLKLNGSYGGYFSKSLWDWLKEGRDEVE